MAVRVGALLLGVTAGNAVAGVELRALADSSLLAQKVEGGEEAAGDGGAVGVEGAAAWGRFR